VRYQAAQSLAASGKVVDFSHGELLGFLMQNDASRLVRNEAAKAVRAMGPEGSHTCIDALRTALSDSEMLVRREAAKALSEMGPAAAPCADALAERLTDDFWPVRVSAAKALMEIQSASFPYVDRLAMSALEDDEIAVRDACAKALGAMGEMAAPQIEAMARKLVKSRLSQLEAQRLENALVFALEDPVMEVRKAAGKGLHDLIQQAKTNVSRICSTKADRAGEEAAARLIAAHLDEALIDEDWLIRRDSLRSLWAYVQGRITLSDEAAELLALRGT